MTKNTKLLIFLALVALISVITINYISYAQGENSTVEATTTATSTAMVPPTKAVPTHQQIVWTYALEWCESGGNQEAINPKDKDNTPSYGSFQFKPETFYSFAKKYNIPTTSKGYMDPEVQRKIVEKMIFDKSIIWKNQFPDCVRKLGHPPTNYPQLSIDKKQQAN